MATYIVKSTDLRQSAAKITQGLRAGDSYIIMHYKEAVGYITSEVPKRMLKEAGIKGRGEFPEVN